MVSVRTTTVTVDADDVFQYVDIERGILELLAKYNGRHIKVVVEQTRTRVVEEK